LLTREYLLFLFDSATARMSKERSGLRIALRNVVGFYKETFKRTDGQKPYHYWQTCFISCSLPRAYYGQSLKLACGSNSSLCAHATRKLPTEASQLFVNNEWLFPCVSQNVNGR